MNCSTPGLPVHHQLPEFTQIMSIESVMTSNYLILCCPLLLLPSIFPNTRVFSNDSCQNIPHGQISRSSQGLIQYNMAFVALRQMGSLLAEVISWLAVVVFALESYRVLIAFPVQDGGCATISDLMIISSRDGSDWVVLALSATGL